MILSWQVLHRWLALIIGLQLLLWIVSGLALNLIPSSVFNTELHRKPIETSAISLVNSGQTKLASLSALAAKLMDKHLISVELTLLFDEPMYQVQLIDKGQLDGPHLAYYWAKDLSPVSLSLDNLSLLARNSYQANAENATSPASFAKPLLLPTEESAFQTQAPVYLVAVNDEAQTRIYLNGASGEVLAHENSRSTIKQWLFMLHFMDYAPENGLSFNHLWIQIIALFSLLLGVSGTALVIKRLYQGHYSLKSPFSRWFGLSRQAASAQVIRVFDKQNTPLSRLSLESGALLTSLNHPKERIKTQCGGGGSCGLCMVRFMDTAPKPQEADIAKISRRKLELGYRLSCQHDAADCQTLAPQQTEINIALTTRGQLNTWCD